MQRSRAVLWFVVTALILALPALYAIGTTEKFALHAAINSHHSAGTDLFFTAITHLGDGIVPAILAVLLLVIGTWRSFLMMAVGSSVSAVVTQLLKRQVFPGMYRPGKFRDTLGEMHWVTDLELNMQFSFPSGHATTAFAMCVALVVVAGRVRWGIPLAILAGLLAFSRVYLSQHFTEDILAGAFVGTACSLIVYHWLYRSAFSSRAWLDRRAFVLSVTRDTPSRPRERS